MKTLLKKLAVVATAGTVISLVGVESATAALVNSRPVTINSSTQLQNNLNTIGSGITNVNSGAFQSNVALWSVPAPTSGNTTTSTSTLFLELAAFGGSNTFGIYDPTNRNLFQIFEGNDRGTNNGANQVKEGAFLDFTPNNSGGYTVVVREVSGGLGGIDNTTAFTYDLSSNNFGFYLARPQITNGGTTSPAATFYTEDDKNTDGYGPHAIVYGGTGNTLNLVGSEISSQTTFDQGKDWILAWEDIRNGGDEDHNDMVLLVENVNAAVPEPLTMLGAGAAAGLGAFFKRQTAKKQKKDH